MSVGAVVAVVALVAAVVAIVLGPAGLPDARELEAGRRREKRRVAILATPVEHLAEMVERGVDLNTVDPWDIATGALQPTVSPSPAQPTMHPMSAQLARLLKGPRDATPPMSAPLARAAADRWRANFGVAPMTDEEAASGQSGTCMLGQRLPDIKITGLAPREVAAHAAFTDAQLAEHMESVNAARARLGLSEMYPQSLADRMRPLPPPDPALTVRIRKG